MKNFTKKMLNFTKICLLLLGFMFSENTIFAQKVAVVGIDHSGVAGSGNYDGISFVATENLVAGAVFYFTNGLYDAPNSRFRSLSASDDGIKFILKYTVPAGGIAKGVVVYLQETGLTTNVLAATCSSGSCGSASLLGYNGATANFSIGSIVVGVWGYSDTDDNPLNGLTTIHSVLFEGYYDSGSGSSVVGNLPANMDPTGSFPNAIVTDGIFTTLPAGTVDFNVVEFKPTLRGGAVSKLNLEDPSNYDKFIPLAASLSTTAFANLNLVNTNPTVGVAVSPSSVTENGATNFTYTFTLSVNATSNITVNYTASGTATNSTDYGSVSGSVVINSGSNSATVIVNPTGDASLEPDETVTLTITSGTGYDIGSPSSATGTITNDDTGTSLPKVALVGISHADAGANPTHQDGFSFVALEDITSGTVVHFTRRIYDKNTIAFGNTYTGTVKWTAGSGVNRGDVYTVMETSTDVFTVTCSDGSSCGTVTNIDAGFSIPLGGITMYAYSDNNDNPTDGVTEIYAALHTGDLTVGGNGGAIPTNSNPTAIYPNAVVIDNFPNANPGRTEYKFPTERQTTVSRTLLTNVANWLHAQSTATALSTVRFTNIIVTSGVANPLVTVTPSPSSVLENSGSGMVYTFTLSQNAASNMTINFAVGGTATFTTDYTQTGAAGFTASTGSVVIPSGSNSASVTITPVADATLEPNETVVLTIDTGTGYDAGSPSVGTGTITNDDIVNVNPLVVIVGGNHGTSPDPDGFSFAANQNLTAGTEIYFTDSPYNNTTLNFSTIESITKYTVPAGGLAKGQVVYIVETGQLTNAFTVSCSAGANCGTFAFISGDFSISSNGEDLYAYTDTDADPTNGITAVHSLFYTINGAIPTTANPSSVFPNAAVVSGFGNSLPNRTEYKFAASERSATINLANIQNTANYLIAQTTQGLSVIPFAALSLCPASIATNPSNASISVGSNTSFTVTVTGSNLTYQWQVNTGSGFTNIINGGIYSGATSATLTLTNVPLANNGFTYQCVVNDCATSTAATLTVVQVPVISVVDASNVAITNGGAYSTANNTDFGLRCVTGSTISKTYTIKNTGQANLTLSGSPLAVLGGTDASQFSITTQPTSPIAPGASTTFTVLFDPNVGDAKNATITLTSNDATNSPYVINIHGVGGFDPAITLGASPAICAGATSFTIPFSGLSFAPTSYSVSGTGITTVTNQFFSGVPSPFVVNLSSPAVFGTNPSYTLTVTNGNGCFSGNYTGSVTVNAAPTATASSNSPVCAGTTINLTGGGVGTYSWSGPNTFTSTDQSPSIATATTAATGIYTITVTNTANCTARATTTVTVNPLPAAPTSLVATPSTVCSGSTTSLSASGCAGTLSWFDASDNSSVSSTPTITANKSFYAKCSVSGCTSVASGNVNVTVVTPLGASPGNVNITWTGLVSTDWNTACNWNPAWVPDATNGDVNIPNTINKPTIFGGTAAVAKNIEVRPDATLTIAATASLTVNGSKVAIGAGCGGCTTAFLNYGTVQNNGQITLGNSSSAGDAGLFNKGTGIFNNNTGGNINIDNCTDRAILNFDATFNNSGLITIGALASVGVRGLNNIGAAAMFNNNTGGEIKIDNATIIGLYNESGTVTNAGKITIGAVVLGAANGLQNEDIFNNNACGQIIVARGTLLNSAAKTFTNAGLVNVSNTLTNNGTFTNNGVVKANSVSSITNNKMVITNACPIFTLGGTNNYTVSGIFTDAGALTSAGTYVSVGNKFTANNTIPTGTQTLYAQVTNGTCTFVVPFDFNNVLPTAVSVNKTSVCPSGSVTLSATCASGTPTWYTVATGGSNIGTGTSLSNSPTVATTYYVACEATNCVSGRVATSAISIATLPTASPSSDTPVCVGNTLTLSSTVATSYLWTGPNSFSGTTQNPSVSNVSIVAGGTYTLRVTNVSGCTGTATTQVVINSTQAPTAPTATPSSRITAGSVTLSATGCSGGTITWYDALTNVAVPSPNNQPNFTSSGTFNFYAKCTGTNTCVSNASANVPVMVTVCTPLALSPGNVDITWTGLLSKDWNTACNWSPAWVPDVTNGNVIIPSSANSPIITTGNVATVKAIKINNGGTLVVNSGATMNIRGNGVTDNGIEINDNAFMTNNGTVKIESATQTATLASIYLRGTSSGAYLFNNGTIVVNSTDAGIRVGSSSGSYVTNNPAGIITIENGTGIEVGQASDQLEFSNFGIINYNGSVLAMSLQGNTWFAGSGTFNINSGTGISNITPALIETNPCGKILMATGTFVNTGTTTNNGLLQMPNAYDFTNTGTFTNGGVVKANTVSSITNNKMVITNACPIFTLGGTNNYTVGGIFTDAAATTSAGTYTSVGNKFTANNTIPTGTQTLYAQVTDGTCTFVVPFDFNNVKPTAVSVNNTAICTGASVTLSGTCPSGTTLTWYTTATGGSNIGTGTSLSNSPTVATTYYVACEATNCVSGRVATSAVTVNSLPNASASSNSPICAGTTLNLTGGAEGNTYLWAGPNSFTSTELSPSISSATVSATGTYTITVTNASSCTATATVAVIVNAVPTATASSSTPNICAGATLSLTGGGVGTYLWAGPNGYSSTAQSPTITSATVSATGTYTITVTGTGSCTSTATTSVTVNALPTATASSSTPTICAGNTVSLTGGGIGTYSWTGVNGFSSTDQNPTIPNASVLASGTYKITVTNVSGCTSTAMTSVTVNANPTATASSSTPSICVGNTISLMGGGVGTYLWTGPNGYSSTAQSPTITNATALTSGTYTIMVTGTGSCTSTATTSVAVNVLPTATASSSSPTICAGNTVSLTGGGIGTYSWTGVNGFSSTDQNPSIANASILASGTYTISVMNANGCTSTATVAVTVNAVPTATASTNTPSICTGNTISLTGGGVGTYAWTSSNGFTSTAQSPAILNAAVSATGTYTITVTNVSGCTSTASVAVTVSALPTATASSNSPICAGTTLNLTGGGVGTYAWTSSNGFTSTDQSPTISNATVSTSGTYTITVTNTNGCTSTASVAVTVNALPTATASSNSPICAGLMLQFTGTGGGTYLWTAPSNGGTSAQANPFIPNAQPNNSGTYTLRVTDGNGCSITVSTVATVNALPIATASSNSPICAGTTLSLTGGGVGTYAWTGPNGYTSSAQSPTITSPTILASGVYRITVTNANSCTSTATTSVTVNPLPVVDAGGTPIICEGSTASLTATCNLLTVSTTLSGASEVPANASTATGTVSGTYDKVSKQLLLTISFNGLAANASAAHIHKAAVGANGGVVIGFSGVPAATSGSFTYTGTLTSTQETDLLAGLYYANIHNANFPGGEIRGQLSTACVANNFVWNPGNLAGQTVTVSPIATQLYTVTASNTTTGCSSTATTTVNVNPRPVPTIGSNTPVCAGNTLNLTSGGGMSYAWVGPNTFTSTDQNPSITSAILLATGTYTVMVTNVNGCTNTATTAVIINALPTATASNNSPICSGATLTLTGGGGDTYLWNGPSGYSSTAQSPSVPSAMASMSGTYTITVTNANGCTSTATTSVTVNPVVTTPTPQANTQIIFGASITLTATGCSGVNDVLKWYKSSDNSLVTMPVSPTATTNFYAKCETTLNTITCISGNSVDVTVTVLQPNPPVATGATNCIGTPTTLTATGCSGSVGTFVLKWYQNADDALVTMPVSPLVSTDYYAKCEQTFNSVTAISAKSNVVTLTILNPPTPVATGGTIYNSQSISLTATGCTGTLGTFLLKWYQTSDNALVTMPVSPTVTTQYYSKCEQTANSVTCLSAKSNDVTVTVVNRIFVDITKIAAPIQNGNTWTTAYGNLQTGLAAATVGVEVWVAKGTYKPTTTTTRTIYFNIPNNVKVYGGFAGIEDNFIDRNFRTNVSILSGDIGTVNLADDNSYHVVTFSGSSNTTVLDGFTITGGNASFDPKINGLPLANNPAPNGIPEQTGGGILIDNAGKPIIGNCTIIKNTAWFGGGVFCLDASTPIIQECNISNNEATFGSAIYAQNASNFTMTNVLMAGNKAIGTVYNNSSSPVLTNCTIASNGGFSGGIYNANVSQPIVKNSILWGNVGPFNNAQATITYSTVEGGNTGVGNLSNDPQLINPAAFGPAPNTTGDYHLKAASLAIDRGNNGTISLTDIDLDGNLRRFSGGVVDMGAYEFQGVATSTLVISVVTGPWEANSTWSVGRVPQLGDYVIIDSNHIVTLNSTGIAKNLEYRGTGQLKFNTTTSKLQIGF
jgi:CHRD domain/Ig-like domain CHU_C associated/Calx-beta domain